MSRRVIAILAVASLVLTAVTAVALWPERDGESSAGAAVPERPRAEAVLDEPARAPDNIPETSDAGPPEEDLGQVEAFSLDPPSDGGTVAVRLKRPPASGLLFDVDTGEVLWERRATAPRPIASLTKMMTALLIAERHRPGERVMISPKAPGVEGSRIGVLKPGRRVPLGPLFLGLLLASGNDAAVALAEHDAGTVGAFVERMNRRAAEMGLECTRFAGPAGLQDTGNSSCAYDLAALARADLANEWVARTMARRSVSVPFPTKGGMLHLGNNHYFVQRGVAGLPRARVTGVKTGLTNGAGRCYVTTARLGGRHLGVVLLDSPDPLTQVPKLLRRGFRAG
jgi:D-alanyl-D-alanine carboxypeptidase